MTREARLLLIEVGHVGLRAARRLGKGRLLRDFWKEGKPVELGRVNATLEDHPRKFKAGQTLFPLTALPGTQVSALVETVSANLDTPAVREAFWKLANLALERGKRTPHERQEARERAFYVDPDPSGTVWRRPSETTKDDAENILLMAMNDYSGQLSVMENPQGEVAEAVKSWPDRPPLPPRVWPKDDSKPPLP